MEVHDRTFLRGCLTFEDDGAGKFEAREGCFDDCVMAWAIALEVRDRTSTSETVATIRLRFTSTPRRLSST